jgi:RNA polymerase sigma-70 factor (ECF subfamily)
MLRVARGDEQALGALYDRWSPLVFSLCAHILGDDDEAEEAVEETFWQAWRQASRYEGARGAVSTWLVTIGRSRALDRLRALRRVHEESWSQLADTDRGAIEPAAVPSADDPQRSAEASERRAKVSAALDALPAEQRETIVLAYFGGLSQSEIAEQTGQPLGTVKTRTRLAMEKLRAQLSLLWEGAP